MKKEILIEINRNRELMGLSLIVEGPASTLLDDILSVLFPLGSRPNSLLSWSKTVGPLSSDIERESLYNFKNLGKKLFPSIPENDALNTLLQKIQKGNLSVDEIDEVYAFLIKNNTKFRDELYDKFLKMKMDDPNSLYRKQSDFLNDYAVNPNRTKSDFDRLKSDLDNVLDNAGLMDTTKQFYKDELGKVIEKLKAKVPFEINNLNKIIDDLKKEFSKQIFREKSGFKKSWFDMMSYVLNTNGKSWYNSLSEIEKNEFKTILDVISKKLGKNSRKIKITFKNPDGKTSTNSLTPEETIELMENNSFSYNVVFNSQGEISLINKLDTNYVEAPNKFFQWIEKQKNKDELLEKLKQEIDNGTTSENNSTMNQIINDMKSDKNFWDNIIKNDIDELPNISNSTKIGDSGESIAKELRPFGKDYEPIDISSKVLQFIDRNIGIDLIYRNKSTGEFKFLQVKKTDTTYERIIDESGTTVKSWRLSSIQKPSQIDGLLIISKGKDNLETSFFIGNRVEVLKWDDSINNLKQTGKIKLVSPNRNGYVEVLENDVKVILKIDGDDLQDSNIEQVYIQ